MHRVDHIGSIVFENSLSRPAQSSVAIGMVALAGLVGAAIPLYVGALGDGMSKLLAFPMIILLGFLFIFSRKILFLLIVLVRAPIDPFLEATKISPFLSLGAVLNALIILIVALFVLERHRVLMRAALPIWGPLLLIALFSAARSPDPVAGIRTFLAFLSYAAVFTAPFYLSECQKDMRFCVYLVLLSSVVPALFGFVDFAHGGQGGDLAGRIQSTFSHPNIFAFYLVLVISLAFYLIKSPVLRTPWQLRAILTMYIAILLALLILTKTRSAWAACFFVFLAYGIFFQRRYLVYLVLASGLAMLVPGIEERVMDALTSKSEFIQSNYMLNSYEWRKLLWESAWDWMQLKNMPFGYGLASFPFYSGDFFPIANGIKWSAHSVYVQWFFEAGVVGVLGAVWLFARLLALLREGIGYDRLGSIVVITVVIEYLVVSYSDNMLGYLAFNWYFWFVVGAACSIVVAKQMQQAKMIDEPRDHGARHDLRARSTPSFPDSRQRDLP